MESDAKLNESIVWSRDDRFSIVKIRCYDGDFFFIKEIKTGIIRRKNESLAELTKILEAE